MRPRRLLRRLISRLYAERDRRRRRRLGARGDELRFVALEIGAVPPTFDGVGRLEPFFADPSELRAHPAAFWMSAAAAETLLAGGDACLAIREGEEIVYRAIVTRDPTVVAEVLGARAAPLPALMVSGVLTHPAHRGRRLHRAAMGWLAREAGREGVRSIVAWVAAWNRSSLRAFARAGFRPLEGGSPGPDR